MAAVAITGATWPAYRTARLGPFKAADGKLWMVAWNASNQIQAWVSSDAGATWGTTYAYTATALGYGSLDCQMVGNYIYALGQTSAHALAVIRIDTSSGSPAWSRYDSGTAPTVGADAGGLYPAFLAVRSTGVVVVAYQSPIAPTYRRVYYGTTNNTGVWGVGAEVDAGGNYHYDLKSACLGVSDRVHIAYVAERYNDLYQRSLSNSFLLDTATATLSTTITATDYFSIFYDATLARLVVSGPTSGATYRPPVRSVQDSQASNTWASDTNTVGSDYVFYCPTVFSYDAVAGKLYAFFRSSTTPGLLFNSTATTTWTTANAAVQTSSLITGLSVSQGRITLSGGYGIGVLYNVSGVYFDWNGWTPTGPVTKYVTLGTATESDSSLSVQWAPKKRLVSASSEVDLAQAIVRRKVRAVSAATEVDTAGVLTAQKITVAKRIAASTATEVDAAQAITKRKIKAAATASEVDSSQLARAQKAKALATAAEVDSSQLVSKRKIKALSSAVETDSAQVIGKRKIKALSTASEADSAQAVAALKPKTIAVGTASEIDAAQAVKWSPKKRTVSTSAEVDAAQSIVKRKIRLLASSTETDTAQTVASRKVKAIGTSSEVDAAQAATHRKIKAVGTASEVDFAQIVSLKGKKIVAVGTAIEVDSAQAVRWAPKKRLAATSSEADSAQAIAKVKRRSLATASEVASAQVITHRKLRQVTTADELDVARALSCRKISLVGTASELDRAFAITRRVAGTIEVLTAFEVDTAGNILARRIWPIIRVHSGEPILTANGEPRSSRLSEPIRSANGEPLRIHQREPVLS